MSNPKVAVVILVYNELKNLENFLPVLLKSSYPNIEFVLVDHQSTDGTVAYVRKNHPAVIMLQSDKPMSFASGYNHVLKQITADYYALLNCAIEVTENWLEPLIAFMEQNHQAGIVQPKIRDYLRRQSFSVTGACGGFADRWGYCFNRGSIWETLETDQGQYDSVVPAFWATGVSMIVRSAIFHRSDGFDEAYLDHMTDVDFCWSVRQMGFGIWVVPQSTVYFKSVGIPVTKNPEILFLNFRNSLLLLTKHHRIPALLWLIPIRSSLDLLSSIFFLLKGYPALSAAVHKGHAAFFFHLGKWWKWRSLFADTIRQLPVEGIYKGSIIVQYYLRVVRKFSELLF